MIDEITIVYDGVKRETIEIDGRPLSPIASNLFLTLRNTYDMGKIVTAVQQVDRLERDFDEEKQARLAAQNQLATFREEVETADQKAVLRFLLKLAPSLIVLMGPDPLSVLWEDALKHMPMEPETRGRVRDLLAAVTQQTIENIREFNTAVDSILEQEPMGDWPERWKG